MKTCTCGRTFLHCRVCGSRSVYYVKFQSLELSQQIGRPISVYGCRGKCGNKTNDTMECQAPPYSGGMAPVYDATEGYVELAKARFIDLTKNNRMTLEAARALMKMEGWKIIEEPKAPEPVSEPEVEAPSVEMTLEDILDAMKGSKK